MANQLPLSTATSNAGGYAVPTEVSEILFAAINRESAIAQLVGVTATNAKITTIPIIIGRPSIVTVGEGAAKPGAGAEFGNATITMKKGAAIVTYTEEMLEYAKTDPSILIQDDMVAAFADWVDSNALGFASGTSITSAFDVALKATSSSVELGTGGDAFALAVSAAQTILENKGVKPENLGIAASTGVRGLLRDARDSTLQPLYGGFNDAALTSMNGVPVAYTHNLAQAPGTPAAGKVIAIVGNFKTGAKLYQRKDIQVARSREGSVTIGGTLTSLYENNLVADRFEAFYGFTAIDVDNQFVAITNAAS